MACLCQCTHIYFALKKMKANVYIKSSHTVAAMIHSLNHFPSKWKIRMVFRSSYRFRVKNSEWSKTAEAQESGLRTYHTGFWKQKCHITLNYLFHPFSGQSVCFSSPSATFSHFPIANQRWESAHHKEDFFFNSTE